MGTDLHRTPKNAEYTEAKIPVPGKPALPVLLAKPGDIVVLSRTL